MTMKWLKVENERFLYRDNHSKAIVNLDREKYKEHLKKKKELQNKIEKEKIVENEINTLKKEIKEIKELLYLILDKK